MNSLNFEKTRYILKRPKGRKKYPLGQKNEILESEKKLFLDPAI